jgi:hypothetical protein
LWPQRHAPFAAAVVRRDPDRGDAIEAVSVPQLPHPTVVAV